MDCFDAIRHSHFSVASCTPDVATQHTGGVSPPHAAGLAPMDIVYIEGFTGQTVIGIDTSELHDPQPVRMNLASGEPGLLACSTDCIEDTIDYAAVREALHAILALHRTRLLEARLQKRLRRY
jgi:dihydroneopterin aldolase